MRKIFDRVEISDKKVLMFKISKSFAVSQSDFDSLAVIMKRDLAFFLEKYRITYPPA